MKNRIYIILFIVLFSCKEKAEVPNFKMTSERTVDLNVSQNTKAALEDLSRISVKYNELCESSKIKEYKVDFYFVINENKKDLIIIQYFSNACEEKDGNVNLTSIKSVIPISKIGRIDLEEFNGVFLHGDKNYGQVFINMEYNSNSIKEEYVESRGIKENRTYAKGIREENSIIIEAPKALCIKIKQDLEIITSEL